MATIGRIIQVQRTMWMRRWRRRTRRGGTHPHVLVVSTLEVFDRNNAKWGQKSQN